jgi:hypothetical protein
MSVKRQSKISRRDSSLRRLLGNVGSGSPSQWAAEKIKREALGTVGHEIPNMKASLTDDMWRISESLDRDKSSRVDPQMLQFRRMMKEVPCETHWRVLRARQCRTQRKSTKTSVWHSVSHHGPIG